MNLHVFVKQASDVLLGWPLIIFVTAVSIACTLAFNFVQIRSFMRAWKETLFPSATSGKSTNKDEMSPTQAFLNTLSANLGNGSIGGIAVAVATGGPGAALWLFVFGMMLMAVRFAEVYLTVIYADQPGTAGLLGGPMKYLRNVPAGAVLASCYTFLILFFSLIGGNAIQANTIQLSLYTTFGLPTLAGALILFAFVAYVVLGGAARIVKVTDKIVPIKVIVFFAAALIVVGHHIGSLGSALSIIFNAAFGLKAFAGGALGFTVQQALSSGMTGVTFATESGLGTCAIFFGGKGNDAYKSAIMSMLSTFISTVVCFLVALIIVMTGAWQTGLTSTELTINAFSTTFGSLGGWIVTFLSVTFGLGVMVSYAYVTRIVWQTIFGKNAEWGFVILYSVFAFGGALMKVGLIWDLVNVVMAFMFAINLFGIAWLLPAARRYMLRDSRG